MKNKLFNGRDAGHLICIWHKTRDPRQSLACAWVTTAVNSASIQSVSAISTTTMASSPNETERMPLCA
jgi:hypothetical protein